MSKWVVIGAADPGDLQRIGMATDHERAFVAEDSMVQALQVASLASAAVIVFCVSMRELVRTDAFHHCHAGAPGSRIVVLPGPRPTAPDDDGAAPEAVTAVGFRMLPGRPVSAGVARDLIGQVCSEGSAGHLIGDANLIGTELVSNGVRHTDAPIGVTVRAGAGRVSIEVADGTTAPPVPRMADLGSAGGRGLLLIDALSSAWGITPSATGKTVWAQLDGTRPSPVARS
ncbi:MAG TPA: ATP-binding protein [Acidimicrobiales bacterium]|jgi:anti-sigma regulatory factor (Ser/Thr protein kinase)|nr:ATP-binding protein [Acidimicrobiales bacterium]